MQNLTQKKIALAVGTALMVMSGGAYAAAGDAPAKRTNAPLMVSNATGTLEPDAIALHTTAGVAATLTLTINFAPTVTANTVLMMKGGAAPIFADGTPANNDIYIHTLSGTTKTTFPTGQIAVANAWTNAGAVTQAPSYTLTPGASGKFRFVSGKLQYSVTGAVADFQEINVDLNKTATNFCSNETVDAAACDGVTIGVANSGDIAAALLANAVAIHSSVVPAVVMATRAKASAPTLVDGVNFTTTYPLAAAPAAAAIIATSIAGRGDVNQSATIADAGLTIQAAAANTTLNNATKAAGHAAATPLYEVFFTDGAAIDWSSSTTTGADAAAYNSKAFNTGVVETSAGFFVTTEGTAIDYLASTVFKADGTVGKLSVGPGGRADGVVPMPATIVDGVSPVIVTNGITFSTPSTATPSLTNLAVTFSEPISFNATGTGASNLREVLENISVGSATLAALSLNSGVTPVDPVTLTNPAANQGMLTITGVASTDVATLAGGVWTGKSISVGRGITYQEVNDAGYAANVTAGTLLDDDSGTGPNGEELAGGVKSASGVVEAVPATPVAQVAVAPIPTIAWGTDTSALASASSSTNTDQIDTITVTFAAGKAVKLAPVGTVFGTATALAAAKTAADLAANLVVDVFGSNGIEFQVRPTTATLNAAGTSIAVTVPTALIYSKLTNSGGELKSVWIGYNADGTNNTNNTLVSASAGLTDRKSVV